MAVGAGVDPRAWLAVDETAGAFLSRSLSTRPPIILPPPLHRAPLRPGNVVEIAGPSNSGKSHLLLMAAAQCILPKEWEGIYFGGLGKAVMYLDLDCRFDVLRLAQILRNRIAEGCSSACPRNGEPGKDSSTDKFHCSFESTLFSDCMQRFLYVRCYSSPEFIAALKSVQSQLRSEVLGAGIYFLMIDSIGAFYWIDRDSQPVRENKGKSLQSITETVVQEIHKVLQLQPALVLVTKSPIYGEGTTAANDFNRVSSKYMLEDSTVLRYSRQEEQRNLSCRDYMPSIWQSFVTHRIKLQVEEAELSSVQENDVLSTHTSEWVQPSLKTKEKFCIRDEVHWLLNQMRRRIIRHKAAEAPKCQARTDPPWWWPCWRRAPRLQ
ncbi:DNA repair protein XRCC2 homolog isoform X3 [Phragmites australis]|uniref:DNA repair protein XRCC2 homolog isoform X3 n=1 Tax=Phragmites australis TaxID=29695 RepID=UPI002D76F9A5|nr:DNA repair protein XRCC2 homolog isoform X3 [Phragmites australis]